LIAESITKSNDGKIRVDQVAIAIRAITGEVAQVKTLVDEARAGSQEQTQGIEQIAKAISQMEHVTAQTAASAEESASAAEELNAQSEALKGIVNRLTTMIGGGGREIVSHARSSRRPSATGRHSAVGVPRDRESGLGPSAFREITDLNQF
jgi:methyl-accepting chemotaxis protein